jgi:carboxymethylenebutenolidase
MSEKIVLKNEKDEISAWHFAPKGERRGGLVLVQEIFGVTDHIKKLCAEYAADGFEVIAPSLYDRLEKNYTGDENDVKKAMGLAVRTNLGDVAKDLQVAIDKLKDPVFMVGYCYGGSAVWVAACRCRGLAGASSYYGRLAIDHIDEKPKAPIILHYGESDGTIPMEEVRQMQADHPDLDIYVYPAGHGFNSDRPTHHHKESAELARERTLAFFHSLT